MHLYISTFSMLLEPTNYPFYTLSLHHLPRHFFSLLEVNMRLSSNFGAPLLFLFFLVSFSMISARPLPSEQGKNIKLDKVSGEDFVLELEGAESLKLLGMEACNVGDEECLQRRMALEVHIDYIYTQHHKP